MVVGDNKFRSMNFSYDANGRQVKATKANVADAWSVYDALGNRVATKVNDVWQFVIYDAFGKLVAEYGTQGEGVGGVSYVLQDWQGSVRASVNNNGFIQARFDFTAFGEEVSLGVGLRSLEQGYTGDATTKQGYGLTEKDSSGQNHTWFRKQEQRAGRWTSPDPYKKSSLTTMPQSWNKFSYVQDQPTNYIDPTGLQLQSFCQWWHTVYDGGPNDGKEVPGSNHWVVCWTIDTGVASVGRTDIEFSGGGFFKVKDDPDDKKKNELRDCVLEKTNTPVANVGENLDAGRENAMNTAGGAYLGFAILAAAIIAGVVSVGVGAVIVAALGAAIVISVQGRNAQNLNKAAKGVVNNLFNQALKDCAKEKNITLG